LEVGPGVNSIEFQYAGLDYTALENLRFRHRLDSGKADWEEAGTRRVVRYHDLRPGRYRFQVQASNNEGEWGGASAEISLLVRPYYWETPLFWMAGVLALAGTIGLVARSYYARRALRQIQIAERNAAVEAERSRIARDIHDDLGAELAQIAMLGELARDETPDTHPGRERMDKISSMAHSCARLLREAVWSVNPAYDSLEHFANYVGEWTSNHLELAGIRCRLDIPETLPSLPLNSPQRHQLFLAIKESIHNAVRHGKPSEISLTVGMEAAGITISVRDNGCGIDEKSLATPSRGLANMAHRMRKIGGVCERRSQPGAGTMVTFRLPLPKEHFLPPPDKPNNPTP